MGKITVAVAQMASSNIKSKNYEKAEKFIIEAKQKGAKVIVFPENFNYLGKYTPDIREKIPDGEFYKTMSALAKQHNIWTLAGAVKEISEDKFKAYNTSVLFSPDGEAVAKYRKIHLCDMQSEPNTLTTESKTVIAGNQVVAVGTDIGKIGLSICYDIRFPELFRLLTLSGAQIICIPACFGITTGSAHWEILIRSIAVSGSCYVLASNQCSTAKNKEIYWGNSMIVDPWGTVIARADQEREALITGEIDLDYANTLKNRLGSLTNRRQDVYRLEIK
ncbi:MAG: carbon-nitrogen hydrolase family protein [Ruminococcaceae bacterium]|nr:carbon-nitrogen hydrolase family protein [Oscillospiraceae bacterium]